MIKIRWARDPDSGRRRRFVVEDEESNYFADFYFSKATRKVLFVDTSHAWISEIFYDLYKEWHNKDIKEVKLWAQTMWALEIEPYIG